MLHAQLGGSLVLHAQLGCGLIFEDNQSSVLVFPWRIFAPYPLKVRQRVVFSFR